MYKFLKRVCVFFWLLVSLSVTSYGQYVSTKARVESGYKGIWFTLGQFSEFGDKYSGGLGTYTAKHIPLSIYSPEVKKTFFVYGGTRSEGEKHLLCMIGSYDHRTGKVSRPVVVHDKEGVDDPHDNPSLAIDDQGHLWVFVSGRGRKRMGYKYRSTEPYHIDSFERITEEEMTYPQPKFIPGTGFLNLFTKYTGMRELYFETSRDGVTWTEDQKLAGIKRAEDKLSGHYQISGQVGEKIVFFFNWHPDGNVDRRTNIYYLQTTDFGETWSSVDGKPLEIPIVDISTPALAAEFYSKGINVYIKDVNFDQNGNPVALFVSGPGHQPGPESGPRSWSVIHWTGDSWEIHKITESDQNYDTGSLWIEGKEWTVVGPTENSPQVWGAGGELVIWKSLDNGKTWNRVKQVTQNSVHNHNYARRVVNGTNPFLYFWADGNPDRFSRSKMYFGDSKGRVWGLPYDMKKDAQRPKRIRNFSN
ncbi:BNR-4 repeat-containing protein [Lunatimonas salinarum]|uniref:BNR-4 repeat-containing protein n=1 Tax=Lunatimonas salinarum TaxID=1774590 RepID=UPI001AE0612C|nr:BNR-4 repeat-containing protein [Lunatimonas salinarum]